MAEDRNPERAGDAAPRPEADADPQLAGRNHPAYDPRYAGGKPPGPTLEPIAEEEVEERATVEQPGKDEA
jgi:hypothetical protein